MEFQGKTAIVTGATAGIGKATARLLMDRGATVIALGRNEGQGKELESMGKCRFFSCDFSSPEQIQAVCETITRDFPAVDILINNAGMSIGGTVETLTLEEWNTIFTVNVTSMFLMSKYLLSTLRKSKAARIINIGSTAGTVGASGLHAYAMTKGAVIQLTKSMAAEYGSENILVNCVCPGGTMTQLMKNIGGEGLAEFAGLFPMKRLGEPEEIAEVIAFLAGDKAGFMNGSTVMVDGGFTCI